MNALVASYRESSRSSHPNRYRIPNARINYGMRTRAQCASVSSTPNRIFYISSIGRVYICVDAMDDLLPQGRLEFLNALQQIVQDAPNTRLFLTGRAHVRAGPDKYLTEGAFTTNTAVCQGGITRYLGWKMGDGDARDSDLMTEDLKNDIMKTMLEELEEM